LILNLARISAGITIWPFIVDVTIGMSILPYYVFPYLCNTSASNCQGLASCLYLGLFGLSGLFGLFGLSGERVFDENAFDLLSMIQILGEDFVDFCPTGRCYD